jgi:hypothetical protein
LILREKDMRITNFFNTLVKGQYEMLRINTPVTLSLAGAAMALGGIGLGAVALGGMAVLPAAAPAIGAGLGFGTISLTISYLLGNRVETGVKSGKSTRGPGNPAP